MGFLNSTLDWWHQQSWLEITGVVTGLLCVYLAAKNVIWNWPIAIVSVSIYIFIFFDSHLYADMGLQVYFLIMNIYGWYFWASKPAAEDKTPVTMVKRNEVIISIIAIVIFTFILGTILQYTPASYPYIDSFCTACSLVAQVFLARKILENWLIWIFIDIVYVGVYIFKGLDLTAIMYAIYVGIALYGYIDWEKEYKTQTQ